jgi:hypothetical protein
MSHAHLIVLIGLTLSAASALGASNRVAGTQFRLIGSGPASVAASVASTLYQAQLAGGSGAPVGISASSNGSVVAGPVSAELPTERLFSGSFED